ncbi:tetratricopeptide repeat protein [candidate division WOR-3 bacterium]|nr:tetratricopeptide repeat protein [candidate division WOR-3 bacterium]
MLFMILTFLLLSIPPDKAYEGARFHDEGNFDKAAELYREALEESPDDWSVIYNLGVVLYEKNEPESAAVLFDSISSQDSALFEMKSDILYNAGTSYLKASQNCQESNCPYLEHAIDRLVKSLILNPFDDECRRNLEIALRMKNNQQDQNDQDQNDQDQPDQDQQDPDQQDQQDQDSDQDQNDQDQQDQDQQDPDQQDQQDPDQQDQQDQDPDQDQNDQDQPDQDQQDPDQQDQQDQDPDQDQNDQDQNDQDQQDQDQQDPDQQDQQDPDPDQDQQDQESQSETPPMTKEQAERILDAALNSPGQDSLLPQDDGKSVPSGQW